MAKKNVDEMSFLDHLEELRWHLIRCTIAVLVIGIAAFIFKDILFDGIIFRPIEMDFPTYRWLCSMSQSLGINDTTFCADSLPFDMQSRKVGSQFSARISTSIYAGIVVGFPYILYQLWKFISPGLKQNEKKYSKGFIIVSSLLFFTGVLFGYYVITPLTLNFLANESISDRIFNDFDFGSVIAVVRSSALACGIMFQLPIVIYFLTKIGLVTPEILKKYRKYALVIVLILSAVITPPDLTSQVIVAIPILILYQVSIFISRIVVRNQKRREQKAKA